MKNKKRKTAGSYLLKIAVNFVISLGIMMLGFRLDSIIFSNPPEGVVGHGIPIFSVLLPVLAVLFFLITTVVNIIKAVRAGKSRKAGNDV